MPELTPSQEYNLHAFITRGKTYTREHMPFADYVYTGDGRKTLTENACRWRAAKYDAVKNERPFAMLTNHKAGREPKGIRAPYQRHTEDFRGGPKIYRFGRVQQPLTAMDRQAMQDPMIAAGRNGLPGLPKSRIDLERVHGSSSLAPRSFVAGVWSVDPPTFDEVRR